MSSQALLQSLADFREGLFKRCTPRLERVLGRFRSWGGCRCDPVAMEHVFPVVCFCIERQLLTTSSTRKRAWQIMPLLRSPSAKPCR
jgi:hypothetical protein